MKARHEFETDQAYQKYLRTYFAAMAMQGLLASFTEKAANGNWGNDLKEVAEVSALSADALINALNQTNHE
jgi:allophanate hydrolase subunit 1